MSRAESKSIAIYDTVNPPLCSSCGKPISAKNPGVSFSCPNCGLVVIWRCDKCRIQGNTYKCPNCGFEGP
ncbi:MAG: zinc finger domain-containing protein [Acidilobaceae archaeon]